MLRENLDEEKYYHWLAEWNKSLTENDFPTCDDEQARRVLRLFAKYVDTGRVIRAYHGYWNHHYCNKVQCAIDFASKELFPAKNSTKRIHAHLSDAPNDCLIKLLRYLKTQFKPNEMDEINKKGDLYAMLDVVKKQTQLDFMALDKSIKYQNWLAKWNQPLRDADFEFFIDHDVCRAWRLFNEYIKQINKENLLVRVKHHENAIQFLLDLVKNKAIESHKVMRKFVPTKRMRHCSLSELLQFLKNKIDESKREIDNESDLHIILQLIKNQTQVDYFSLSRFELLANSRPLGVDTDNQPIMITYDKPLSVKKRSTIYLGNWRNKKIVIKEITRKLQGTDEVGIMERLTRENVPNIVTCYFTESNRVRDTYCIGMEYFEKGNLSRYLQSDKNERNIDLYRKWIVALLESVEYMHESELLHNDLKGENVLLGDNLEVKLADFGFATTVENAAQHDLHCGSYAWMAPEIMFERGHNAKTTDMYSFGMMAWEIIDEKGRIPHYDLDNLPNGTELLCERLGYQAFNEEKRMPIPNDCPALLKEVIIKCWPEDPQKRISASKAKEILTLFKLPVQQEEVSDDANAKKICSWKA